MGRDCSFEMAGVFSRTQKALNRRVHPMHGLVRQKSFSWRHLGAANNARGFVANPGTARMSLGIALMCAIGGRDCKPDAWERGPVILPLRRSWKRSAASRGRMDRELLLERSPSVKRSGAKRFCAGFREPAKAARHLSDRWFGRAEERLRRMALLPGVREHFARPFIESEIRAPFIRMSATDGAQAASSWSLFLPHERIKLRGYRYEIIIVETPKKKK